jgi:hypothetical protein
MIIDAMDLLYTTRFDGFCLVSSDSDFTRLAARIRESGLVVYGFGEHKTPKPFVAACDQFIYFENIKDEQLGAPQPIVNVPESRHNRASSSVAAGNDLPQHVQMQLRLAVKTKSDEEGWANLANVGDLITRQHPDFDPRTFGYS